VKIALTGANGSVGRNIYTDPEGLTAALDGVTCVVHLAGILIESRTSTYETGNVASTRAIVDASTAAGVGHLVLVSVLGADSTSPNRFLRSKGEAERLARESGIGTTILRTPILLGPGTAGSAALRRSVLAGRAKLLGGGRHRLRPLDVDDLSRAIIAVCSGSRTGVELLELVGPEPVSYRVLVERAADLMGRDVSVAATPVWMAKAGALLVSRIRGGGVTPDVIDVITSSEMVDHNADVELGITLTPLEETLKKLLTEGARAA
jgi:NADH dehydrogenase